MPEGVLSSGGQVAEPTFDDPKVQPPDDPKMAPNGWTWDRHMRSWRPKKAAGRGGNKSTPQAATDAEPSSESGGSDRDPDPGWFADNAKPAGSSAKRRLSIDDVPQSVRDDIAGFAGLVGAPILAMLQQADPYCGTALAQSFEPIVDACLPLICRSEKIVKYFTGDQSDWLLWGKLALALRPFATAVLQHHVLRTVDVVRDEQGLVHVVERRAEQGHGDHLTPPQRPAYAA